MISHGFTVEQAGEIIKAVTPQLSVPEVTALAEWTTKLTKASEDAYNKGYADGMKAQEPILDKLRAEIETKYGQCDICKYFVDYDYNENDVSEYRPMGDIADILQIIDKYKAESEADNGNDDK
jgi:hypothetical protein